LSGFEGESGANWRVSLNTLFSVWHIEGLGRSFLEIELISKGLLLSGVVLVTLVVIKRIVSELSLGSGIHLVKKGSVHLVFVIPLIFLISGII
jgi:hypothetical protein